MTDSIWILATQSQSSSANRKDLMLDKQPTKPSGPTSLGASRKLAKAEETLDRRDAEERGHDWERMKNWRYTMEDEERWNEKLEAKEEKRDKGMIGECCCIAADGIEDEVC